MPPSAIDLLCATKPYTYALRYTPLFRSLRFATPPGAVADHHRRGKIHGHKAAITITAPLRHKNDEAAEKLVFLNKSNFSHAPRATLPTGTQVPAVVVVQLFAIWAGYPTGTQRKEAAGLWAI